jgi:hypothetical protein
VKVDIDDEEGCANLLEIGRALAGSSGTARSPGPVARSVLVGQRK